MSDKLPSVNKVVREMSGLSWMAKAIRMTDTAFLLELDLAVREAELAEARERIERLDACVNGEVPHGALNALGRWLAPVLDEDKWATAEKFLNAALLQLLESTERAETAERERDEARRDAERIWAAAVEVIDAERKWLTRSRPFRHCANWKPPSRRGNDATGEIARGRMVKPDR